MQHSVLEQLRFNLESIDVLEQAIAEEMTSIHENPKERCIGEHRIFNFVAMLQERAKSIVSQMKEEQALRKEELSILEGQTSLRGDLPGKSTEKKKATDMIWQNFYEKAKEIRDQHRNKQSKQDNEGLRIWNTVQYYRSVVFKPPFKEPQFSAQEGKGKYVDMHSNYLQYLNLCKILEQKRETRMRDYLWFLQHFDRFDAFPIGRKVKHMTKYLAYLSTLRDYLIGFINRTRPLTSVDSVLARIDATFTAKYTEGRVAGWSKESAFIDQSKVQYCAACKKLFVTNEAYVNHLMGRKHRANEQKNEQQFGEDEAKAWAQFHEQNEQRNRTLAAAEHLVSALREEVATPIYDTMNLVRKKQTRGYEEVAEDEEEEEESEEEDAPIYNPKNLPLGWDGKPIPYWLYKLHGLGIEYKCEICGNYSYWGRRAFEMHFQEWRHTYGMRCLKIPNTIHFRDITSINDALALHQKLTQQAQEALFRPQVEEEFQDNQGNLLNRKTYFDMRKQGLID